MKKILLHGAVLALAIGLPIGMCSTNGILAAVRKTFSAGGKGNQFPSCDDPATTDPLPRVAPEAPGLSDCLSFDVTVPWITRHWPRVSSGLSDVRLQGYRVPLVTGSGISDVAGSLTYYFDAQQQAQRLTLRGTTGDPTTLVELLASRFHFTRRVEKDRPGLVLFEAVDPDNQLLGTLTIRFAPVIKANQPYTQYVVDLTVNRPPTL
jgi:hypothetical protein